MYKLLLLFMIMFLSACSGSFVVELGQAKCEVTHRHTTMFSAYGLGVCTDKRTGKFLAMDLERGLSGGEIVTKVAIGAAAIGIGAAALSGIDISPGEVEVVLPTPVFPGQ